MPIVGKYTPLKSNRKSSEIKKIERCFILTHERPGLLLRTIQSLTPTLGNTRLTILDDASQSKEKTEEIQDLRDSGFEVVVLDKSPAGLIWTNAIRYIRNSDSTNGVVLLEDDLLFDPDWLDALLTISLSAFEQGFNIGAISVFRHSFLDTRTYDFNGIKASPSVFHSFQCNLFHIDTLRAIDLEKVEDWVRKSQHGIDTHLLGWLSHNGYTNFVSDRSYIGHIGSGESINGKIALDSVGHNMSFDLLKQTSDFYTRKSCRSL